MRKTYNKLVRDRIPQIIEETGKEFSVKNVSESEYGELLRAKLQEEVTEYQKEPCLEELADILEVVYALAELEGSTPGELEVLRNQKQAIRGGFNNRYFLEWVEA